MLTALGFSKSNYDASLYTRMEDDGYLTILVSYVVEMLIVGNHEESMRLEASQIETQI